MLKICEIHEWFIFHPIVIKMRIFRNFNFQFAQFFFCYKFRPHAISKSTPDILQNTPAWRRKISHLKRTKQMSTKSSTQFVNSLDTFLSTSLPHTHTLDERSCVCVLPTPARVHTYEWYSCMGLTYFEQGVAPPNKVRACRHCRQFRHRRRRRKTEEKAKVVATVLISLSFFYGSRPPTYRLFSETPWEHIDQQEKDCQGNVVFVCSETIWRWGGGDPPPPTPMPHPL